LHSSAFTVRFDYVYPRIIFFVADTTGSQFMRYCWPPRRRFAVVSVHATWLYTGWNCVANKILAISLSPPCWDVWYDILRTFNWATR